LKRQISRQRRATLAAVLAEGTTENQLFSIAAAKGITGALVVAEAWRTPDLPAAAGRGRTAKSSPSLSIAMLQPLPESTLSRA
jgi:hypothetical protein